MIEKKNYTDHETFMQRLFDIYAVCCLHDNNTISLINRNEFIHSAKYEYKLKNIQIHSNDFEKAMTIMRSHLIIGFF